MEGSDEETQDEERRCQKGNGKKGKKMEVDPDEMGDLRGRREREGR